MSTRWLRLAGRRRHHSTMRFFNTSGPIIAHDHYHVPPLSRLDLEDLDRLVAQAQYFVLHAPRQTGKTTALRALRDRLNEGGAFRCVYVNVEPAQTAREDVGRGMRTILGELSDQAIDVLDDRFVADIWPDLLALRGPDAALRAALRKWAAADRRKPLVLLIDEIDALIGDTLVSVLRQLRAGHAERPANFPQSVILCGVRDVRDYRIHASSEKEPVLGGSAFNVKAESLRLGDFRQREVADLLGQHTAETGQPFAGDAISEVWRLSRGQPCLVNALARVVCFRKGGVLDRSQEVTLDAVQDARERLILRRDTHLDQLVHKLEEPRVRRVIEPILSGDPDAGDFSTEDLGYARDLGLVTRTAPLEIANPIYQEVIPRELSYAQQEALPHDPAWFVQADGRLDMDALMRAFQEFFRDHSEHWVERFQYKEAGPQLLLQAFLQRVVNSGGRIEREYGVGRRRMDLAVIWREQRVVVECKVVRGSVDATVAEGLPQTASYMDRWGADDGHLAVFDRTSERPWSERLFRRDETFEGRDITVWGM